MDEFLGSGQQHRPAVPQTYNMSALLDELQMTQQAPPPTRLHPSVHKEGIATNTSHAPLSRSQEALHTDLSVLVDVRVKEWVEEFAPPQAMPTHPSAALSASEWTQEFEREYQSPITTEAEQWYNYTNITLNFKIPVILSL